MNGVATLSRSDREALFRETAARKGIGSAVITEKDFWVCWTLQHVFALKNCPKILFKGGTSLSKGFGLIERFSEDIDLSLNRADLGFEGEADPLEISGTKARKRAIEELAKARTTCVAESLLPELEQRFSDVLGNAGWALEKSQSDPAETEIEFTYPPALQPDDYGSLDYIRPAIRLEIGARADHQPSQTVEIQSYAAEYFPDSFDDPATNVVALDPVRTFWEKATIFHAENGRPERNVQPPAWTRLSRHAYDLFMLEKHGIATRALRSLTVLEAVASHKGAFYGSRWAEYPLAKPGTFRLGLEGDLKRALRDDYNRMRDMIFADPPSFDEICDAISRIEAMINSTH